jgi:hypothetical protein
MRRQSRDAGSPRYAQMREALEKHFDAQLNRMHMDASLKISEWERSGIPKSKIKIALKQIWERYDDAPYEMPGEGQTNEAREGHNRIANPRQPQGDGAGHPYCARERHDDRARPSPTERDGGGHLTIADKAKTRLPPTVSPQSRDVGQRLSADKANDLVPTVAATQSSGGGHGPAAEKANVAVPPPAAPRRLDPTPSQIAAMVRMHKKVHTGPLDDFELSDGRTLGGVLGTELPSVIGSMQSELAVIGKSLYGKGHQLLVAKHIYETYVKGSDNAKRPVSEIVSDDDARKAINAIKSGMDETLAAIRPKLNGVPASLAIEHLAKEARA